MQTRSPIGLLYLLGTLLGAALVCPCKAQNIASAEVVLTGGKILILDSREQIAQAIAIRNHRILAFGTDKTIRTLIGPDTKVISLHGKTVVPGLIESHVHPLRVSREEHDQPYEELPTIAAIQQWIRRRAGQLGPGEWVRVPRNDITRIKERRHPTPAELDEACNTRPVIFTAAVKSVLNTAGFRALGITPEVREFHGGKVVRDSAGHPLLITGADAYLSEAISAPKLSHAQMLKMLPKVLRKYNEVGITSIAERRSDAEGYQTFRDLEKLGQLPVRATVAIYLPERTPAGIEKFVKSIGLKPGDGDDWVKVGSFKIAADGGIHWGTSALSEAYGPNRIGFYRLADPNYRGELFNTAEQLRAVFETATHLGWQVSVHATGDAATDQVLDAMEAADRQESIRGRRFTLIHGYFPTPSEVARVRRLQLCIDTQPYLYYKDSDAIAEVYGKAWAERFIGLGDWERAGVPVSLNSDHMIGLDPDHAMNSFNPFLQLYIAVSRKNQNGHTYGSWQKLSRIAALRGVTTSPAYMDFNEKKVGSLEVGKLADLAVLDRDYLTCPEEQIREIKVLMTILDGKSVYERSPGLGIQ